MDESMWTWPSWQTPEFPCKARRCSQSRSSGLTLRLQSSGSQQWQNHIWLGEMTVHAAAFRLDDPRKSAAKRNSKTSRARRKLRDEWAIREAAAAERESVSFLIGMFSARSFLSAVTKIYSDTNPTAQSSPRSPPSSCASLSQPSVCCRVEWAAAARGCASVLCSSVWWVRSSAGGFHLYRNTSTDPLIFTLTAEDALTSACICCYGNISTLHQFGPDVLVFGGFCCPHSSEFTQITNFTCKSFYWRTFCPCWRCVIKNSNISKPGWINLCAWEEFSENMVS